MLSNEETGDIISLRIKFEMEHVAYGMKLFATVIQET